MILRDPQVRAVLAAKAAQVVCGLITLVLIPLTLSPEEQGYWFTFSSLLALQVVCELGLSTVIVQCASHEAAHLGDEGGRVPETMAVTARGRLATLLHLCVRWYAAVAIVSTTIVWAAGASFFTSHGQEDVHWRASWAALSLSMAPVILAVPVAAFLEGIGLVVSVAKARLLQSLFAAAGTWIGFACNLGLFSAALGNALGCAALLVTLALLHRNVLRDHWRHPRGGDLRWRRDVWPMQWKIGVSWLSGWIIFQSFTPAVFAVQGPGMAGRLGMSLDAMRGLTAVSMSWMNSKAASFGRLVSLKRWQELDQLFNRQFAESSAVVLLLAALGVAAVLVMQAVRLPLGERFLPPLPLVALAAATVLQHGVNAIALYLRAHKEEPLLWPSVLGALLIGACTLALAPIWGATGVMLGFLIVTLVVGVGGGVMQFQRYRKLWHDDH